MEEPAYEGALHLQNLFQYQFWTFRVSNDHRKVLLSREHFLVKNIFYNFVFILKISIIQNTNIVHNCPSKTEIIPTLFARCFFNGKRFCKKTSRNDYFAINLVRCSRSTIRDNGDLAGPIRTLCPSTRGKCHPGGLLSDSIQHSCKIYDFSTEMHIKMSKRLKTPKTLKSYDRLQHLPPILGCNGF